MKKTIFDKPADEITPADLMKSANCDVVKAEEYMDRHPHLTDVLVGLDDHIMALGFVLGTMFERKDLGGEEKAESIATLLRTIFTMGYMEGMMKKTKEPFKRNLLWKHG